MLTLCDYVSFCRFSRGPRPPSKSWPKLAAIQQSFIASHFGSVCVLCDLVFFCVAISRDGALSRCHKVGSRCSVDQSRAQSSGPRSTAQSEQRLVSRIRADVPLEIRVRGGASFSANSPQSRRVGKLEAVISVLDERPHCACNEGSSPSSEVPNPGSLCGRADRKKQALHRNSEEACFELSGRSCKKA